MYIDINCDVGESLNAHVTEDDAAVIRQATSVSVACGFHAGNPSVIRKIVQLAVQAGVAVGAHPGLPDRMGFGRREMKMDLQQIEDLVLYQIAALAGIVATEGARLQHVKPHGALYNMAARDLDLSKAIARAVVSLDSSLILFGLAGSILLTEGAAAGLRVASEAFADRAYNTDGTLLDRDQPGSVLHDLGTVEARALQIVCEGSVGAVDGSVLPLKVDTICVHGDTPAAANIIVRLRAGLEASGVNIMSVGQKLSRSVR